MKRTLLFLTLLSLTFNCGVYGQGSSKPVPVIFETDMGNDVDDALALDIIYKAADLGKIELLAICSNKNDDYSPRFIDLMNTWYGYPEVPIGKINVGSSFPERSNYAEAVCKLEKGGGPMFPPGQGDDNYYGPVELYRRELSRQEDNSVVIISVGFSTTLARLLESGPDDFSPLTGTELVARKVKLLSSMAGSFRDEPYTEFNVKHDIEAARFVFEKWPGEIVLTPFEIGIQVEYPAASIENDFGWAPEHPVVEAYKAYAEMPYDRPAWDLISVLYVLEPDGDYYTKSNNGLLSVDEEGVMSFREVDNGRDIYLTATEEQAKNMLDRLIEIITTRPLRAYTGSGCTDCR